MAYTIAAAQASSVFESIWVCADHWYLLNIGVLAGVKTYQRSEVGDDQPDVVWVQEVLRAVPRPESFAILRPTSPFRTAETIRRAFREFQIADGTHDSLRAVSPATENPYKMWTWEGAGYPMKPLLSGTTADGVPLHSAPSQAAPKVWLQDSSLEMAYTRNVEAHGSIAGRKVIPFFSRGWEGFSIDTEADWERAAAYAAAHPEALPPIATAPLVDPVAEADRPSDSGRPVEDGSGVRGPVLAPVPAVSDDLWGV